MNEDGGDAIWTKQDTVTLGLGLVATVVINLSLELIRLEELRRVPNWQVWLVTGATGTLGAVGRYLVTFFAQRGFSLALRRRR